ncbi:MAG: hypothetical protein A2252_10390 [Elusimicrobia bacterium RIFOXYA2_FULL_39_19]|nr:MAG: hypothetical protein A2252_10390 [Elusimicrobia bacterium RIFOXYA2_FULL_39_19]
MKKIIINADDFGLTSKINQGVISAHKNGVVTSASMLASNRAEGFDEAVALAKENPGLEVGVHIDLDRFFDVDQSSGVIFDWLQNPVPIEEVKQEARNQINRIKSQGLEPFHLTSHHHSHLRLESFPAIVEVANEFNIKVVRFSKRFFPSPEDYEKNKKLLQQNKIACPEHFIEGWYWGNVDENYTIAELATHPGYGELWREYELTACCNPQLKVYLNEKNIQLITFKDLL